MYAQPSTRSHLAPTTIQTEKWETLRRMKQDQTLKQLAKGPLNLASGLILFAPPPRHKMLHTNNNSVNNNKHYCQHVMIRRSCIKIQIPTFFFFFAKSKNLSPWCLLRSSRAGLWPPPSHGAALSKTSQFPPISVVSLRPNISSYLSS